MLQKIEKQKVKTYAYVVYLYTHTAHKFLLQKMGSTRQRVPKNIYSF